VALMTIERHLLEQQKRFPEATGAFSGILYDIALAAKVINREVARAALADNLGAADSKNSHGEQQQKLDLFADETIFRTGAAMGRLCAIASEEREDAQLMSDGKYALVFDPLDGSSNINVNVGIGTIFGIYRKVSPGLGGSLEDVLQPGYSLAAAGYVVYGPATMLVYTTGQGVFGFTLDPTLGEFLLSHPNMRFPECPAYYSANQSQERYWAAPVRRYIKWLQGFDSETAPLPNARYTGSLVMDFHRNLLDGGIFCYPGDIIDHPNGKLRLVYEAAPLALIAYHASGYASDGTRDILAMQPTHLHQRTPLFIGNRSLVEKAEQFISEGVEASANSLLAAPK
jgi:fructose-1,6-bisphosphatase I